MFFYMINILSNKLERLMIVIRDFNPGVSKKD